MFSWNIIHLSMLKMIQSSCELKMTLLLVNLLNLFLAGSHVLQKPAHVQVCLTKAVWFVSSHSSVPYLRPVVESYWALRYFSVWSCTRIPHRLTSSSRWCSSCCHPGWIHGSLLGQVESGYGWPTPPHPLSNGSLNEGWRWRAGRGIAAPVSPPNLRGKCCQQP